MSSPSDSTTIACRRISSAVVAPDLLQLLQRDVDRVVERGRSVGGGLPDGFLERRTVVRERLQDAHLAVEVDDFRLIVLVELRCAKPIAASCAVGMRSFHAGAGVEQERQRDRLLRLEKKVRSCLAPSSKTSKSSCSRSVTYRPAIGDRDVQRDQLDAGAEPLRCVAAAAAAAAAVAAAARCGGGCCCCCCAPSAVASATARRKQDPGEKSWCFPDWSSACAGHARVTPGRWT